MHCAIEDHTKTCDTLKRRADLTQRALFGEMYNAVTPASTALPEKERLKQAEKRLQRRLKREDSDEEEVPQENEVNGRGQPSQKKVDSKGPVSPLGSEKEVLEPAPKAAIPVTSSGRKEIWAELSQAQKSGDAKRLRRALELAVHGGFSAVTIRSAKQKLLALGGNTDGL
eukprot:symbB.v1.2.003332.t1/scaffold171.1/size348550/9